VRTRYGWARYEGFLLFSGTTWKASRRGDEVWEMAGGIDRSVLDRWRRGSSLNGGIGELACP